MEGESSDLSS